MPPRKKRKKTLPSKPGVARGYIQDTYSNLSEEIFRNGHALFVYYENETSLVETCKSLQAKLSTDVLHTHVRNLLAKTIWRYKNLSQDSSLRLFKDVCQEPFHLSSNPKSTDQCEDEPVPGPSTEPENPVPDMTVQSSKGLETEHTVDIQPAVRCDDEAIPGTSAAPINPVVSAPVRSSKRHTLTPRKQKLKRKLQLAAVASSEIKDKYKTVRKELKVTDKASKSKSQTIKYLRRKLREKDEKMKNQHPELKKKLANLQKNYRRMKRYYKEQLRQARSSSVETIRKKDRELNELQSVNEDLENVVATLQEETDEEQPEPS